MGDIADDWTDRAILAEAKQEELLTKLNKIMKSRITKITGNGTFESKHGLLYKFEYEMEDGTILTANHKTESSPFEIGTEVEYEIKGTNDYGSWGSVKKPQDDFKPSSQGGGISDTRQQSIVRQTCLKAACDYYSQRTGVDPSQVLTTAELFENWVNRSSNGTN